MISLSSKQSNPSIVPPVLIGTSTLENVNSHQRLGMICSSDLTWTKHIDVRVSRSKQCVGIIKRFKYAWPCLILENYCKSYVPPIHEYGDVIYDNCSMGDSNMFKIKKVQSEAAIVVTEAHTNNY